MRYTSHTHRFSLGVIALLGVCEFSVRAFVLPHLNADYWESKKEDRERRALAEWRAYSLSISVLSLKP